MALEISLPEAVGSFGIGFHPKKESRMPQPGFGAPFEALTLSKGSLSKAAPKNEWLEPIFALLDGLVPQPGFGPGLRPRSNFFVFATR